MRPVGAGRRRAAEEQGDEGFGVGSGVRIASKYRANGIIGKIPISINDLQIKVWGHKSRLETHTVETHVYRLRKKIIKAFGDNNFIKSSKKGYKIN